MRQRVADAVVAEPTNMHTLPEKALPYFRSDVGIQASFLEANSDGSKLWPDFANKDRYREQYTPSMCMDKIQETYIFTLHIRVREALVSLYISCVFIKLPTASLQPSQ